MTIMNTQFRILWIDDDSDYYESTEELIRGQVLSNNMNPSINFFGDYEEFRQKELDNFEEEIFNRYDLLIIDYALSDITGIEIIQELRKKQIYTDIVFYSSELHKMRDEVKRGDLLDGIFFADRKDLTSTVNNVIRKNMRREYSIANIRGLIMDSTSEFDYICRITAIDLFSKLSEKDQNDVETQLREFVKAASKRSTQTFEKLNPKKGQAYVSTAMNSTDYVMSNVDRYSILKLILQRSGLFTNVPEDLDRCYDADVIRVRNKLAHSMLFYGECQKKLHITKVRQELKCDMKCGDCKAEYDLEACELLRKKLFKYYCLLSTIDKQTSAYLRTT